MKVSSPSGDFEVLIKGASMEGNFVVLKVQMGVWDSKICFNSSDIWNVTKFFVCPSVLLFLKIPLRFLLGRGNK